MEKHVFPLAAQRKYIRIPFKEHGRGFDGCDCGGLVWLIYREELGVILPNGHEYYRNTQIESFSELTDAIGLMCMRFFKEVQKGARIEPYDIIVFSFAGNPVHVGVAINSNTFIHVMEGYTNVRTERLDSFNWNKRIEGVFRYAPLARP